MAPGTDRILFFLYPTEPPPTQAWGHTRSARRLTCKTPRPGGGGLSRRSSPSPSPFAAADHPRAGLGLRASTGQAALGDDGQQCRWRASLAQGGHGERVCVGLGSLKDAREKAGEGRSDLGHPVTLLAALETRSALGVALYRLPRLSLSLLHSLCTGGVCREKGKGFLFIASLFRAEIISSPSHRHY